MVRANKNLLIFALAISSCFTFACAAKAEDTPKLKDALPSVTSDRKIPTDITPEKVRKTKWLAYRLAKYEWFEKLAEADPRIVAAVCAHPGPAKILAKHRHLDKIAEADHYLCRRLCRWKGSTDKLVRSPYFDKVVELDPAGMSFAMNRNPVYARVMARQTMIWDVADNDRDMLAEMQKHMK